MFFAKEGKKNAKLLEAISTGVPIASTFAYIISFFVLF
jgi:hypothetical protein